MSDIQFVEEVGQGYVMRYKVKRRLFSGKSAFQKVEVYETENFGKMLLNDDLVMITERDEFVYHEMITHPALFLHPDPKNVLVIGGGDGGTAREVLRHPAVQHCDMVEIDKMVVDACREFIPQTAIGMEPSERFDLHIDDGVAWVKNNPGKYDVIIVDSTDPIGPAQPLFGTAFYKDVLAALKDENGIVISQAESPFYNSEMQAKLAGILHSLFPKVWFLDFHNLTYPGGLWSFSVATRGLDAVTVDASKVKESRLRFKYYSAEVHKAAFTLPQFQKENLAQWIQN